MCCRNMRTILCVLLFVGAALALPPRTNRIVGGELANAGDFPFMANMQWGHPVLIPYHFCGGSLITNRAVLSAAHCLNNNPSRYSVVLGSNKRNNQTDGVRYFVSQIFIHPKWNLNTGENDVAILHLTELVTYTNLIQSARIAGPNFNLPDGSTVTFAGWGHTEYQGYASDFLRKVDVNVINQSLCAQRYTELKLTNPLYRNMPDVTDDMMCAGILDVGGKDACGGDSGGPLVYDKNIIVGITSWGFECADGYYPGVVSRVSYNSDWIRSNV